MIQQYRSVLILAQDSEICSVANSGFSERDDNDCTAIGLRRDGCSMVYKSEAFLRHIQRNTAAFDVTYIHRGSPKQSLYLQS